jgi:hypothetical protein
MKLFLVGGGYTPEVKDYLENNPKNVYLLKSYYYIATSKWIIPYMNQFKGFLLDSGAFTFMTSQKNAKINWERYVIEYGNFVKKFNINHFFELDIDSIVGLKEVERLRDLLEKTAERKCIPVWHKSRGLEYWKRMCQEYDYVAIGGIVSKEIKRVEHDVFYPLLKIAKENNTKVHGLGFTDLKGLEKYKFYSVDSTCWLSGGRYGMLYTFNGKTLYYQRSKKRKMDGRKATFHCFNEWVKFSKYAENYL